MSDPTKTADSGRAPFVVVGLGASAGGLEALEAFFAGLPATDSCAFVVVIHLAPERESEMADILARTVPVPVVQVRDAARLEVGHVYVIPPDKNLAVEDGHLRLTPLETARRERRPVDHFFRTLGHAYGDHAVAVVLSGTGHNGTVGIKAVKEAGGLVFAQDPDDAGFAEMPSSAIASGNVDTVARASELGRAVLDYSTRLREVRLTDDAPGEPPSGDGATDNVRAVQQILAQVRVRTGHDFSHYKRSTVLRRLERRLHVVGAETLDAYVERLRQDGDEARELLDDLLISVTNFFRDPGPFGVLERTVVPKLFDGKTPDDTVRVWTPGCATGEETYSLAILLAEHAATLADPPAVQVFGTDLSEAAIRTAREGLYPGSIEADVTPERLQRFFRPDVHGYRIRPALRETVLFAPHNLLKDPPFSRVGLVACRNVLIYFQRVLQERALGVFHYALAPGGFLFLGTSETADVLPDAYRTLDKSSRIYQRREITLAPVPILPRSPREWPAPQPARAAPEDRPAPPFSELHDRLRAEAAPPSILVSDTQDAVHFSDGVGPFLKFSGGEPTRNVVRLVRPELRIAVQTALYQASQQAGPVVSAPVRLAVDGADVEVRLRVRAVADAGLRQILFEARPAPADAPAPPDDPEATALGAELRELHEQLHLTAEEFETSREELQSQNEELQSANEELRSTAEELETSKEEAQSMAEELLTVNDEMKASLEELTRAKSDLENIIVSTEIATLFLDRDLTIKWFSPQMRALFHVRSSDVGRPLVDLAQKFGDARLVEDAEAVLDRLQVTEREVRDDGGRWHLVAVRPYRTADDRIDGVVVTFVDITERRASEDALRASEARYRTLFESIDEGFVLSELVRDAAGQVVDSRYLEINPAFEALTGLTAEHVVGRRTLELFPDLEPAWLERYTRVVETGEPVRFEQHLEALGRWFDVYAFALGGDRYAGLFTNVTERRASEDALRTSEARYRALFESMSEGFAQCEMVFDADGQPVDYRVLNVNPAFETVVGLTREQVVGKLAREIVPGIEQGFIDAYGRVVTERTPLRYESRLDALDRWLDTYAYAIGPEGSREFAVVVSDISERKRAEEALRASAERAAFRVELADAVRPLTDPEAVQAEAAHVLGRHLGANRVHFTVVDKDDAHIAVGENYTDGVEPISGRFRMDDYGPAIIARLRAGEAVVVPDVAASPDLSPEARAAYAALEIASELAVPLIRHGRFVAALGVHQSTPRAWTPDEVALVRDTAERAWASVERASAQAALSKSEARYRTLFTSTDEGFALSEMIFDDDGAPVDYCFLEVNPAFETMTGLPADSAGRSALELIPDLEPFWVETYARVSMGRESLRFESPAAALGRWFDVFATPVGEPEQHRFAVVFTDITARREDRAAIETLNETLEHRVAAKTKQVRRLAARLAVAEQDERQRIAHLLHDDLQQQLYGLSMVLALLQRAPDADATASLATRAAGILDDAVAMARTLATELSPVILQASRLEEVLAWTAAAERDKHGLEVTVEVSGDPRVDDPAMRILLYQSLREVLLNVVKHSGQRRVRLVAETTTDAEAGPLAVVRVEDDGVGFDASVAVAPGDGFGLFSVRERLALVGGRFAVESAPGQGARVTLSVPSGAPSPESP